MTDNPDPLLEVETLLRCIRLSLERVDFVERRYRFRELSLVREKLEEAQLWYEKLLKMLGGE